MRDYITTFNRLPYLEVKVLREHRHAITQAFKMPQSGEVYKLRDKDKVHTSITPEMQASGYWKYEHHKKDGFVSVIFCEPGVWGAVPWCVWVDEIKPIRRKNANTID